MDVLIESRAVKALAHWKAKFADEVSQQAKLVAAQGNTPQRVTLQDYQQAALIVMPSMLLAIATEQATNANRQAA